MYISLLIILLQVVHHMFINALPYYDKTSTVIVTVTVIAIVIVIAIAIVIVIATLED